MRAACISIYIRREGHNSQALKTLHSDREIMGKVVYTMLFFSVMASAIAVATSAVTAAETVSYSNNQRPYYQIHWKDGFYEDDLYRYGHMGGLTSLLPDDFDLNERNILLEEAHRFQASSMEAHDKRDVDGFLSFKEAITPIHLNR